MPRLMEDFDRAAVERAVDGAPAADVVQEAQLDAIRRLVGLLEGLVFTKERDGELPSARMITARWLVIAALLGREKRSLAQIAGELGCSRAWLSKLGVKFATVLGMQAPWQRPSQREAYAKRAKGVHAGTWEPSGKWERRKLRDAKRGKLSREDAA